MIFKLLPMKIISIFICLFLLAPIFGSAQSKAKTQKKFLAELNTILQNSKEQSWNYPGKMSIDSAFALNKNGILSSTVRYSNDDSFIKVRMQIPLNKIKSIGYDLFLILISEENNVDVSEFVGDQTEPTNQYKYNLFHIGVPLGDGFFEKEKLENLVRKLKE